MHVGRVVAKRASPQLHNRATAVLGPAHLLTFRNNGSLNNVEFLPSPGKCQARKQSISRARAWPSWQADGRGRAPNESGVHEGQGCGSSHLVQRASKCDPIENLALWWLIAATHIAPDASNMRWMR